MGKPAWPKTYRISVMDPHHLDHGLSDFSSRIAVSVRVRQPSVSSAARRYIGPSRVMPISAAMS